MIENFDFWSSIDSILMVEILGAFIGAFFLGWATGYKLYLFRRFAHAVT